MIVKPMAYIIMLQNLHFFISKGFLLIVFELNNFFTSQVHLSTLKQREKVLFWSARSLFYESILVSFLGFSLNFQWYPHCKGFLEDFEGFLEVVGGFWMV